MTATTLPLSRPTQHTGAREFRLIYALGFAYFLLIALVLRPVPRGYHPCPAALDDKRSVWGEARALTDMLIPFAFTR